MSKKLELSLELDPRVLVPTSGPRDVDENRVRELAARTAQKDEAIVCVEVAGFLLLIDGHHRWAAQLLRDPAQEITVQIVDAKRALSMGFHTPAEDEVTSLRSVVYDWEAALNVRLAAPDSDEGKFPLVVVCGPSGVGKTALLYDVRDRLKCDPFVRSATSRNMRSHEKNGVDYDFYSADEFEKLISERYFAEWQYVHGKFYGSIWTYLFGDSFEDQPRTTDLDIYGAIQLKALFPRGVRSVFVDADSINTIRNRLLDRASEGLDISTRRLSRAQRERQYRSLFDQVVINSDFAEASQALQRTLEVRSQSYSNSTFFEDPSLVATYASLSISDGSGNILVWLNSQKPFPPSICVGTNSTLSVFRLLEDMVIDQLSDEIRKLGIGGSFLSTLSKELERATVQPISGCGLSPNLTILSKKVIVPEISDFILAVPLIFGLIEAKNTPWHGFTLRQDEP
jgi:guanylate kinase